MSEENWWPSKDEYDPKITKEKWLELLKDEKIFNFNSMCMMKRLLDFGGEATCVELAEKYGKTDSSYNMASTQLARRILKKEKKLKSPPANLFPVLYLGRRVSKENAHKGFYIWKLREELKSALEEMDLSKYPLKENYSDWKILLSEYKKLLKEEKTRKVAFDDEVYKWETITKCKDYSGLQILSYIIDENLNLVDAYARGESKKLLNDSRFENVYKNLINESKGLSLRLQDFKEAISSFYNDSEKKRILKDEHSASLFLTCNNPQKYTFYKASYYESLCKYLHIDSEEAGEKYEHYLSLIDEFVPLVEADSEIMNFYNEHTKNFEKSSKLIAQNIIYVLFESGKNLVKLAEGAIEMSKAEELAKLLEHTHNLILHGAPGTGKTYLAHEIADVMDCTENEIDFVQFHPSYDYTDFVEGLRPVEKNGQISFERKDGRFKKFCEKAILSYNHNDDVLKELNDNPTIWKVSLEGTGENPTRTDCMKNGYIRIGWDEYGDVADFSKFDGYTEHGGSGVLVRFQSEMRIGDIVLSCYSAQEIDAIGIITGDYEYRAEGGVYPRYRTVHWLVKGIRENILEMNNGKAMTLASVYRLSVSIQNVIDIIKKHTTQKEITSNKKFIFIIDEINRGEMSKILGELFFSIDPGYRGKKGRIQTQYQNLVNVNNIFYEGFYVPENVYIIGTMNDIDRNVESMDFAFRRRFTFKEVTAKDTQGEILTGLDDSIREEAIGRMDSLNKAIWDVENKTGIEGLSSAYHIGGAYFLKLNNFEGSAEAKFAQLWNYHLEGLLREYLRGMEDVETNIKKLEEAYNLKNVADSSKEVIENS